MNSNTLIIYVSIVVAIVVAVAIWLWLRRQRSERLRTRFGPEYERAVREAHSPAEAERDLEARAKKVAAFRIRSLNPEESGRYQEAWRKVQARFVDQPKEAVLDADSLITDVMHTRGYPVTDFDARTEHLSVDHARTVEDYRTAHDIVGRYGRGEASTEDLRQAMVHYRALFQDLVGAEEPSRMRKPA